MGKQESVTADADRSVPGTAMRALSYLRAHGLLLTARRVFAELVPRLFRYESHVWYERSLVAADPVAWPPGLALVPGGPATWQTLELLDTVGDAEAWRRLANGTQWWLVEQDGQPVFSCWIFHGSAPVQAAPGHRLPLPPDTVVLEDSVTAAAVRGRGVAPLAWSAIALLLLEQHVHAMLTKVDVSNAASRRAVTKAGFREIALMKYQRLGPWSRTAVQPIGSTGAWLSSELSR